VLEQDVHELEATGDHDVTGEALLQVRGLADRVAGEDGRVAPDGGAEFEEITYLALLFSLSASAPLRDGHREAKNS